MCHLSALSAIDVLIFMGLATLGGFFWSLGAWVFAKTIGRY